MAQSPPTMHTETRQYRAPAKHGEVLSVPEFDAAWVDAQATESRITCSSVDLSGVKLADLRKRARAEVITKAVAWTNRLTGQSLACEQCSHQASLLFVSGHQPQLAHAGVWVKNFAAAELARRVNGVGLNIVVDNDTVGSEAIKVPVGSKSEPRIEFVSFDESQPQQPWEELTLRDRSTFTSFAERVSEKMSTWNIDPLLSRMWPDAIRSADTTDSLVEILSACRVAQERRLGVGNLEVPLSEICQTESFLIFVHHLILNAAEFHTAYNEVVHEYRAAHKIRNDRHPVPDLEIHGDALELPFWYWWEGDSERGQVFVRQEGQRIELICREKVVLTADAETLFEQLQTIQNKGKLRTRALTTTLFSRLFLADLFIHGIGGAKYDEMTDALMARVFGVIPPGFLVLSATLHLPIETSNVHQEDLSRLKNQIRAYQFNADRHLNGPEVRELHDRKEQLIADREEFRKAGYSKSERREYRTENRLRHRELMQIKQALNSLAQPEIARLTAELQSVEQQLRANSILKSRDFSASLFPESEIRLIASRIQALASG